MMASGDSDSLFVLGLGGLPGVVLVGSVATSVV